MTILRSVALFVVAAIAEIGGAYLVWQGVRRRGSVPVDGDAITPSGV